jgi:hypothetical protein
MEKPNDYAGLMSALSQISLLKKPELQGKAKLKRRRRKRVPKQVDSQNRKARVKFGPANRKVASANLLKSPAFTDAVRDVENKITLTKEVQRYIDMVTDPALQGQSRTGRYNPESAAGLIIDGDDTPAIPACLTGSFTIPSAVTTAGSCLIALHNYVQADQIVDLTYGVNAEDGTATMTTVYEHTAGQIATLYSVIGATTFRPCAAFLRVWNTSQGDLAGGKLRGAVSEHPLRSAAAVYNTNAVFTNYAHGQTFGGNEGITVRMRLDRKKFDWQTPIANCYGAVDLHGPMPRVQISGMPANSVWQCEYGYYMEAYYSQGTMPFAVHPRYRCTEFDEVTKFINESEYITAGHSFKDVMTKIWQGGLAAGRFIVRNKDTIMAIAKTTAKLF